MIIPKISAIIPDNYERLMICQLHRRKDEEDNGIYM